VSQTSESCLHLPDEAATAGFAAQLADELRPGDVLALCGPLGAGKTTFTRALVATLGHPGPVTSPTFTLVHEYHGGRLPVLHLDFHRLKSAAELHNLGWDELLDQPAVVIAEWADLFPAALPPHTRWLRFSLPPAGTPGRILARGFPRQNP